MSDSGSGSTQIHLQTGREQKDRWKRVADSHPEVQSLSGLIRISVEEYIDESTNNNRKTSSEDIEEIKSELAQLRSDLEWLKNQYQEDSIGDLAEDLHNVLVPLPPDDAEAREHKAVQIVAFENQPQSVVSLAEKLGTTPKRIEEALDYLKEHKYPIEQYEMPDGRTHFFKLEEES